MVYGYCRISTAKQSIERQVRNILDTYPNAHIVREVYTGTKIDRKEWNKLYKQLKAGDTVVFDSVSRMSRNAEDGTALYMELYKAGINLVYLKEPQIDTATYTAALKDCNLTKTGTELDYILDGVEHYLMALAAKQIELAFAQAQKEVDDLHQRTKEGIETARLNGKQIGQLEGTKLVTKKSKAAKALIKKHSKDFGGNLTDVEVMKLSGISRNTYYKYKAELKVE